MCLLEGPAFPAALHSFSTVEDLRHIRTTVGSCFCLMSMPDYCSICRTCNLSDSNSEACRACCKLPCSVFLARHSPGRLSC